VFVQVSEPAEASALPSCTLDDGHLQMVCTVVNTCEYCAETTGNLAGEILKRIDDALKDSVDLAAAQEDFQGVVTAGMRVLVAALETKAAPALVTMTKLRWDAMDEMSEDTSAYMADIVASARETMRLLGESLHPLYVRFFCDKYVASFVPRLLGAIYKCKRIADVGAQQMQVDIGTLKLALLDLPTLGQANVTSSYTKLVNSEVAKAEQVLKLVQTPEEALEATVHDMRAVGVSVDLQKILELKGLKKGDAERMTEAMANKASEFSAKMNENTAKMKEVIKGNLGVGKIGSIMAGST
jgi:hypothetical protein